MYIRISGPVYDNEKENWRILTIKGVYNNIYLLQLGCHPVAVVILHVNKT